MNSPVLETLKLLADATRFRILRLLMLEELAVAEIQEALSMGQSRISTHLGLLRQSGLLEDRREGKKTFYKVNPRMDRNTADLVESVLAQAGGDDVLLEDRENLKRILKRRREISENYFNTIAGRLGKNYCPGRSWEAIGHCLLRMIPAVRIVDLGAGEGMLSHLLARRADSVVCVDFSPKMVEFGESLAAKNEIDNLEYVLGDIESVPLEGGQFDIALLSQALHHAVHPERAVAEAFRLLKPGGQVLILDLKEHNFEKARELYADAWLGFAESRMERFLREAGFKHIQVHAVAREEFEPHFETLLATGTK